MIECGVALAVFYNLLVLRKMEEKWGIVEGRNRFDELFGSKHKATPEHRRLIISPFSIIMGTQFIPELGILPVQPLSYLVIFKDLGHKNNIPQQAKIGWQVMFMGDPNYYKKHAAGSSGAFNCVVTSLNPFRVRSVGSPGELTEDDLIQLHMKEYERAVSYESFALLDNEFKRSLEFYSLCQNPTKRDKIPGLERIVFALNEERLNDLIEGELSTVVDKLDRYIQTTRFDCVMKAASQHKNGPLDSELAFLSQSNKNESTPKAKPAAVSSSSSTSIPDNYLSGLKGLRGMYCNHAAQKIPQQTQVNQTTASEEFAGFKRLKRRV